MDLPTVDSDHEDTDVASLFDAADEFHFDECSESVSDQTEPSTTSNDTETCPESFTAPVATLRRRRSSSVSPANSVVDRRHKNFQDSDGNGAKSGSNQRFASEESENEENSAATTASAVPGRDSVFHEKEKVYQDSKESGEKSDSNHRFESEEKEDEEHSTVTTVSAVPGRDAVDSVDDEKDQYSNESIEKTDSIHRFASEEKEDEEHSTITTANAVPGRDSVVDKKDTIDQDSDEIGSKSEWTQRFASDRNDNEVHSAVTYANEVLSYDSVGSASELDGSSFNLLMFFAGLVIKAIGFQINLFITFMTFPIWGVYNFCIFLIDPFHSIRRCRDCFIGKVSSFIEMVSGSISPFFHEWFKDQNSFWKLALRYGWGLLWAFYVGLVLCSLLASSLVISGFFMRYLVIEPIQMKQVLNFDFTKLRPVAFVPIMSCANSGCGVGCDEEMVAQRQMGSRVIPTGHKLQVTVLLTLPESEYNRNLGIFQVRVDLLSIEGETLASSSHPCMLQFQSEPIRLFSTFLRIAPLMTGYGSESQTLKVNFKGFVEGDVPTACLKVSIEQRAEYRPGAGIPEMYESAIILESELPLLRRWLWYWKMTIFVWIAMATFAMELLSTLVCCRPIIMPRVRARVVRTTES